MLPFLLYLISGLLQNDTISVQVDGKERSYYANQKGDNPTALIFYYHQTGGTPDEFINQDWYSLLNDVLIISPVSAIGSSQFEWYLVTGDTMDDVYFFDHIVGIYNNFTTIYAVGFSAGAVMVSHLVYLRATTITKAVILSGGFIFEKSYASVMKIPDTMLYYGGPTDVIPLSNFSLTTAYFLEDAKNTNANVEICQHDQGHSIQELEIMDAFYFLTGQYSNISQQCSNTTFVYKNTTAQASSSTELFASPLLYFCIFISKIF